ncbi:Nickel and cobalt resistance protein CnrB [Brevundimonas sp. SH203]|uniref:efflux RND transporter periplasmic adaptor subunit n=1 Tax=Brevundimonas sp. SH203 TaxID=345167 RepID=UPI0009CC30A6|nr:efflux RND transporter periplasmic adaptor subunit [Brevundimonas sp. SH203]GAW40615.1 Nickel and cobalt resistance protein CnrB [Brevundimonas sp. SH203]
MTFKKHWLMTGAAVVIALGAGFAAARILDRPPTEAAHAEAGHAEEAGEEAFVKLTPQEATRAGVSVVTVQQGGGAELKLPGRVAFAPGAEAAVDAPLGGAVARVHVGLGDRVAAGSPLITVRSPDGAASRADADAAGATVEAARAAERRDRALFEKGWVSQARLDVTAAETRRAEAQHRAARARVGAFGAPGSDGLTVVRSPIAGVVTRISAAPGQVLHEEALQVAAVADPGRVELLFEAPPAAAAILKVGDVLESTVAGSRVVSGVVIAIAPANAAGVVIVRARPSSSAPPAGSVVSARISAGVRKGTPVVPLDAVQTVNGVPSVFVQERGGFRARPVVTGRTADGGVEILSGLNGAEQIAGVGAFLLKAELAKGEAEHGH